MIYLEMGEVIELHRRVIEQTGGSLGLRDPGLLASAVAQPEMAFGGVELYPTVAAKAAALAFSLIKNHPFVDGNKRVGHAAMETFLILNGLEIAAMTDEQESLILQVAAGHTSRDDLTAWLEQHMVPRK